MNALFFSFFAAGFAALANLFFRKNSVRDVDNFNSNGYLVCFYLFSFLSSLIFNAVWTVPFSLPVIIVSGCVGALNVLLMGLTSKALRTGPSGLTFAFQNAGAVFPGVLLFFIFGSNFGYSCSSCQILGVFLVVLGLFLGARTKSNENARPSILWVKYAIACFLVQILALTCIQGRCILFDGAKLNTFFSNFSLSKADDAWFMPGQFGISFILQTIIFLRDKKRIERVEAVYGFLGGIANFACTCFLLLGTKFALPAQQGILFPIFAVATIVLCNVWSNRLYGENFNLLANTICAAGIILGVLT